MSLSDEFVIAFVLADLCGVCGLGCACFLGMSIDNAFKLALLIFGLIAAYIFRRQLRELLLDDP